MRAFAPLRLCQRWRRGSPLYFLVAGKERAKNDVLAAESPAQSAGGQMKKRTIERSLALYARAKELMPGAAQLISRRPTRAAFGASPIYAERAKGCRIWDIDGNEHIDWHSGVGPIILGYCDEVVDAAVKEQVGRGSVYSILEESQVRLAEELVRIIPSAEMVRFCKGGGRSLRHGRAHCARCDGARQSAVLRLSRLARLVFSR